MLYTLTLFRVGVNVVSNALKSTVMLTSSTVNAYGFVLVGLYNDCGNLKNLYNIVVTVYFALW